MNIPVNFCDVGHESYLANHRINRINDQIPLGGCY